MEGWDVSLTFGTPSFTDYNNMSEEQSLKQKTAKGLFWGGLSSSIQQLLGLLFGIVLGRLLDRSDYGMIGMLAIFPAIASALQESGLVAALANREKVSDKDYNAVFWFSISCGATLYVLLYFSAPLIADFYDTPELTSLARFSFLSFFIASFGIAPRAILFRNLKVKENTIISLSSLFVSGMVAIILAANGFAYWGIAIQTMVFVLIGTMLNWYFAHWKPSFRIDFSPIKEMFGFSSKMLITQIFIIINQNLFSVLLGKFYTKQEVGDFSQANNWNNKGHALITGMINGVTQPVLASVANDPQRQAAVFHKMLRFTAFISFPAMFGLSLIAKEFILITITDKWLASARIMQLLCIWGAFIPVNNLFSLLLVSRGRSSVFMFNSIALSVLQLITACISYPYGITTMIYLFVAINILWMFVWYLFARREIPLTLWSILKDIAPYFLLAASLTITAHYITLGITSLYLSLAIKVVFVASLYALVLWKMQSVIFNECIQLIKKKKIS